MNLITTVGLILHIGMYRKAEASDFWGRAR